MKLRFTGRLLLLGVVLLQFLWSRTFPGVQGILPQWKSLADGIEYREFYLPGPNHVYVSRMDRLNPGVTLDTSLAQGRLSGGLETVRDMAKRYDQAINDWGEVWGGRNQVLVAINGSFYDPQTGIPFSGQVHSAWYAKRFDERQSGSGFAWTLDRQAFIGECVVHPPARQVITFVKSGDQLAFEGLNRPRGENDLVIYTPQYDSTTLTDDAGLEVLVELSRPLMILPEPAMITGTVEAVFNGQGSTPIPFDHIVLSASGSSAAKLGQLALPGDALGFSQEIKHYTASCKTPLDLSWSKTYASLGGGYYFLKNGVVQPLGDTGAVFRSPRTAVVFNDRYIYFVVVDGRDRLSSLGMSMTELAVFARNYLGAAWGVALDGGGSSTMVVNGQVMNNPNAELDEGSSASQSTGSVIERFVANGLMMVVVLPKEQSSRFQAGDQVAILASGEAFLRLGPGLNYAVLGTLAPNSQGVILEHHNHLNGVLASGEYWWKVSFGNLAGWVSEAQLVGQ